MAIVERHLCDSDFTVEDFQKEIGSSRMQLQDGITIEVSGSGKLENDVLTYSYKITGFSNYSVNCIATRK